MNVFLFHTFCCSHYYLAVITPNNFVLTMEKYFPPFPFLLHSAQHTLPSVLVAVAAAASQNRCVHMFGRKLIVVLLHPDR